MIIVLKELRIFQSKDEVMSTYLHYRNIIGKKYENMEKLFIERIFNDYSEKDLVESTQFLLVQI